MAKEALVFWGAPTLLERFGPIGNSVSDDMQGGRLASIRRARGQLSFIPTLQFSHAGFAILPWKRLIVLLVALVEVRKDVVLPDLCASEVLVRSRAVGVNPLDMRMREGYGRSLFEPLLPLVLGRDVSGEVTAVGSNVQHFHVGDQVFGALHPTATRGTYSEFAILGEEQLAPKPESLSYTEAAAIPFASLTA